MNSCRWGLNTVAALTLTLALSACQKASSDVSSTMPPEDQTTAMSQTPTPESAPVTETQVTPEQPVARLEPVVVKPAPRKSASTKSTTKSTTAVPASESRTVSLPAGSTFDVELATAVNTGQSNVGDKIEAKLVTPLKGDDGSTIAPAGAVIHGEIAELTRASKSRAEEDRASVKLAFTSVETVFGEKTLAATVTNVESLKAGSTTKRDALVIAGSAAAGAILGKVAGHDTKDAMIGGLAGAVVGTGVVMAQKGHELDIPAGSKVSLRSDQPITVVAR
ncbi:MAG TPA: hypothetical protein VL857_00255 [Candidatus Eisenbacteria bacterium]|jgi:hypothetical protein|nr:hypothetical protein [Candidatus Eisenbacteria bacterium]